MSRLHALFAVTLAVALHLAAFAWRAPEAGASASGVGGDAMVSLEASSGSIAQMVEEWERPPEPMAEPVPLMPQPEMVQPEPPQLTTPDLSETPLQAPVPPMALPQAPEMPSMDIAELPPPPPEPEPEPEPEPLPRAQAQPKREPAPPPSAAVAGQRAAGSGGGANAGASGSAQSATNSSARATDLAISWGASIRARVERRAASVRGVGGTSMEVQVAVSPTGGLLGVTVTRSSGDAALDAAVVRAVRSARLPAAPAGLTQPRYIYDLPLIFTR